MAVVEKRATAIGIALALSATALAAELKWSEIAPLPAEAGNVGAFVAVIDDNLVVAGGLPRPMLAEESVPGPVTDSAWVLESLDGAWRATTPLPEPLAFGGSASFGSFAVFAGGSARAGTGYRDSAFKVSFKDGELAYEALPDMPEPRAYASGAMLDAAFYLVCGARNEGLDQLARDMLVLDLAAADPQWKFSAPLPGEARYFASAATQDGALFVIGGSRPAGGAAGSEAAQTFSDSYRFRPEDGWRRVAERPSEAGFGQAAPLGPTHIAVVGGDDGSESGRSPSQDPPGMRTARGRRAVEAYHTITDTWVTLGEFPFGAAMARAVSWNGQLVVFGGVSRIGDPAPPVFAASLEPDISGFTALDYTTLTAYFCVLVMMGVYFASRGSSTEDFFLAGRRMPWWATGLSIFGTQLSSISFMAVPAKVYATDWVYFLLQMTIVMIAVPVVFLYLPYFRRTKMTSAYEYLETRFNLPVRMYASVSFVLYQIGRMAIVLFLPSIALSTVTGISVYTCILVMGILSTLYTVMGGMKAVIWTDVLQVFVLYGGALVSLAILVSSMNGGLPGIVAAGLEYDKFHMFNWTWDWTTTAVWVVVVGNLFMNLVPYTSDQAVVQRYFTTKDEKAAARSIWTNAILIIPSTLTLFLLGTGLWAFYRANPELLNPSLPTDSIFPLFISQQLPAGIAGLLIAALFAASMSTLDSSLNSVSTALVTDFFARFRPRSSDRSRLRLARYLTGGLGVLATSTSIALATFDIGSLWDTFQGMMGLLGGGLAGLFALGIFFPSATGRGAMTGAVASVFILYWVQQHTDLHFFLYGAVGVLSCVGIGLVSSMIGRPSRA